MTHCMYLGFVQHQYCTEPTPFHRSSLHPIHVIHQVSSRTFLHASYQRPRQIVACQHLGYKHWMWFFSLNPQLPIDVQFGTIAWLLGCHEVNPALARWMLYGHAEGLVRIYEAALEICASHVDTYRFIAIHTEVHNCTISVVFELHPKCCCPPVSTQAERTRHVSPW